MRILLTAYAAWGEGAELGTAHLEISQHSDTALHSAICAALEQIAAKRTTPGHGFDLRFTLQPLYAGSHAWEAAEDYLRREEIMQ